MVQSLTMRVAWIIFGALETVAIAALQADVLPPDLLSIFIQLPLIGLFAWYVLKKDRDTREWIDQLLEDQEKRYNKTIDLFERIIDKQDSRQAELINQISDLGQQLVINTATVNESMRLGELAEELKRLANDNYTDKGTK